MALRIQRAAVAEIERHALEAYPDECCGVVLSTSNEDRVRRITNIQQRLHAEDPVQHPRDASIAYFMDPKELYAALSEAERGDHRLRVFYHSHPDHDAYFSAEDKARAMAWDEPAYPNACYLVVSVKAGVVGERLAVSWDPERRDFVTIEIVIDERSARALREG